jgi:uncharacterized protein
LQRRQFLSRFLLSSGAIGVGGLAGWHYFFDGPIFNSCQLDLMPDELRRHELMLQAFDGIDFNQVWDCHFHLVGNGLNPSVDGQHSGVWLSEKLTQSFSLKQRIQYEFYMNASCIGNSDFADLEYVDNISKLLALSPQGVRYMLLAFDYHHNDDGQPVRDNSTFYVPNEYAAKLTKLRPGFEWIGSVHPYREGALEQLEWCSQNGARAIKWLPPAMNIDPSSTQCEKFYQKLIDLDLPLLTHAGEEQAVHSDELQRLANPLLLRNPLEQGVKVIVAHCASLGSSVDIESNDRSLVTNLNLFARLMNEPRYQNNLFADISAINLFNRQIDEIRYILQQQSWHSRLLYASDFPLPGVMPVISSRNLASHGLLDKKVVPFLNRVREHNSWLFDFLQKRFLNSNGARFSVDVFHTRRHFVREIR